MLADHFFDTRQEGDALVVAPRHNVDSMGADHLEASWDEILAAAKSPAVKGVVFDFKSIDFFGSAMLEAMLAVWHKVSPGGGKLVICNASAPIVDVLRVARFNTLWPTYKSREEALQAVRGEEA